MATNFDIDIDSSGGAVVMKLQGDFDATSAYELIYAIKKLPEATATVSIQTNGLKSVYSFGVDVFHRFMRSQKGWPGNIVLTGHNASQLLPADSRLAC